MFILKRLCVYLTYDKEKIVDSYIGHMLRELRTCADTLIVVCNEDKVIRGTEILEKYADEIYYRENIGFDAGGFKDALCGFIGWERVLRYDEMVLANDSFFGPFYPMKIVFEQMEAKNADFWGLAKHGEVRGGGRRGFSEYIQTYFLVVRKTMLYDPRFRMYWEKLPFYQSFEDVVFGHEEKFTSYFVDLGYTYEVLADIDANNSTVNMANNYFQYAVISYELIRKRNFPFLKKQPFSYNTLDGLICQTQENLRQSVDYIDRETDYDVDMIWENLIRTMNMTDLQRSLHFQYIIPSGQKLCVQGKTALVVFVSYSGSAEYVTEYLTGLPLNISIHVFVERSELLTEYQNLGLKCKTVSYGRTAELLADFCGYDFVCVLHDADMSSDVSPSCVGKSYFYHVWDNLIKNAGHVSGVLAQFVREPRLGFLTSPQPNFGKYFGEYGKGWDGAFEGVFDIVRRLRLACQISAQLPPFRITDNFWIRGCILEKLKCMEPEDSRYLPFLPILLAQDAGFYSGIVESAGYASMNEVNMQHYLTRIGALFRQGWGDFNSFHDMKEKLFFSALEGFRKECARIYIYGAGESARRYGKRLPEAEAYIVTDGRDKPEDIEGKPVKYLSQISVSENCGIVLCMSEKYQREVISLLERRGLEKYLCI